MKNNSLLIEVSAVLEKNAILQQKLQRSLDSLKLNINSVGISLDTTKLEAQIKDIRSLLSNGMEIKPLDLTDTIVQIETLKNSIIEVNTLKEQTSKATLIKSGVEKPDISESVVKSESNVPKLTEDLGNLGKAKEKVTLASTLMDAALSTGVSLAIDLVISGVMKLADELITTKAELREFNEEATKVTKDNVKTLGSVEELVGKSKDLEFKINASTNADEANKLKLELIEVQKELANALPESISGFDSEGNAISANKDLVKEMLALKREEMVINAQKFMSENDGINGIKKQTSEYAKLNEEIEELQKAKDSGKETIVVEKGKSLNGKQHTADKTINVNDELEEKIKKKQELMEITQQTLVQAEVLNKYDNQNIDTTKLLSNVISDNTEKFKDNTNAKYANIKAKTDEELAKEYEKASNELNNVTNKLGFYRETLKSLEDGNGINSNLIANITQRYPELLAYANNEVDLKKQLNLLIGKQENLYDETYRNLLSKSVDYYNDEIRNNTDKTKQLLGLYQQYGGELGEGYLTDYKNFTTVEQAKAGTTESLINSLAGAWSKYFNYDLGKFSSDAYYKIMKLAPDEETAQKEIDKLKDIERKAKEYKDKYDGLAIEPIKIDLGSIGADIDKGSKSQASSSSNKEDIYKAESLALEKVNAELEKNKLLEEREEDSQKKVQWKQREISLLIQKSTILDQIYKKMGKSNEKDLLENRNQWEQLQNEVKKLNGEILNLRIEDISSRFSKEFNKLKEQLSDLDLQEARFDENDLNGKLDIANKRADLVKKQIEEKLKQLDQLTKVPVTNEIEKKRLDEEYAKEIDALRDLQIGYENLNKKVKDVNKEKLQIIEEVESQITEVIKKQVEQRKKSIEDEYNKRVETINKIKKLYNQENEEVDRNKELSNMQGDLDTIKREYEESLRDMSMAGKKRSADLLKQIEEQEQKISELIERQERDRYNEFLDSQLEHLDEQKKDDIKKIEDTYTDEKISEIVKGAMLDGFFKDIEGNIVSVKEAYINYMDEFNNGTSLAGVRIKSELLDSMNQVKDSIKEISSIWESISVKDFSILTSSLQGITSIPQTMAYNIRNAYNQNTSVPISMPLNFNMGMADKDFIEKVKRNSNAISKAVEETIMRDNYIRK